MNSLTAFREWVINLNESTLDEIVSYYDEKVFFKDPFNEFNGREKLKKLFLHMFITFKNPHFVFIDTIENSEGIFLTWNFIFSYKEKLFMIHGSSHLKLNDEKKIVYHRDYWDVGEELLLKIPLIKSLYGFFQNKLALSFN
ncbi:nuclear transport factor 2 family protein [Deltaproteobacteria bacterium]|nr:nuclear transport factor 2 family protein [Deltaproteobacteria bacterium]